MIPTLHTDRLTLRPYQRVDWDAYLAFATSAERTKYMGGPRDVEGAWGWFTNDTASWAFYGFGTLALDIDGDMIGFSGLVQPPYFPEPECGWALFDGYEGQGYATEAAKAVLAHTFENTDLATIVSYVDPANTASAAVATRLGGIEDPDAQSPFGDTNRVFRYMRLTTGAIQ